MSKVRPIGIALLGLGVVGSGVARVLLERRAALEEKVGRPLELRGALVRDPEKTRPVVLDASSLKTDAQPLVTDPDVDIVVEVLGGEYPAVDLIKLALDAGKHVVTANKEVMAKHGPALLVRASEVGRTLAFEASVGGGVPIVAVLQDDLVANRITALRAIINGTTNYILTQMSLKGVDFHEALAEAQRLGYAEPDPRNDIEGTDAAYKLAILTSLAFHIKVDPNDIFHEGIARLSPRDFRYARELGYAIKLLAIAKDQNGQVQARVHPVFLPQDSLLAQVQGAYNAIQVEGDLTGPVVLYGQGAGAEPTSSAIWADVLRIARNIVAGAPAVPPLPWNSGRSLLPFYELETRYYVRMSVADRPGVLAQIARVFGEYSISIASVIQKETDEHAQAAEIVIMTHLARESAVQAAMAEVERLPVVREIGSLVRVEA